MTVRKLKLVSDNKAHDASLMSDDDLMVLSAAGRTDCFEILVKRYYGMTCAMATQYLGDALLGKDVAQDTFFSIWTNIDKYVPSGRFRSYLVAVVFNRCRMMSREQKSDRKRRESYTHAQKTDASPPDVPLEILIKTELDRRVQSRLRELPDKERKVLVLRFGQDLSVAETAELLGMPVGTVKSHASRGLKRLHKKLKRRQG